MKLDWNKVWDSFEAWTNSREAARCGTCGHKEYDFPEWDEQQKKIQKLVNAQLRKKA